MKWVLIFWLWANGGIDHVSFDSREACEAARASVQTEDTRSGKYLPAIRAVCVARGNN